MFVLDSKVNLIASDPVITLSIAAVERDTGLSKDTLRVWERRYGFPTPERDSIGERAYTLEQVDKLRIVKRLLDAGHRPGRIVPLPLAALQQLTEQTVDQPQRGVEVALGSADLRAHLQLIRSHDVAGLRAELQRLLARLGVGRFVVEAVGPLNAAVGDAWIRGQLEIFEEHLYTEVMQGVLRQAIAGLPETAPQAQPRVLLTTFPGEPHGMGLLMAEALLRLEGCHCGTPQRHRGAQLHRLHESEPGGRRPHRTAQQAARGRAPVGGRHGPGAAPPPRRGCAGRGRTRGCAGRTAALARSIHRHHPRVGVATGPRASPDP
jgi:DNA-binding transcriptional MerR regulator